MVVIRAIHFHLPTRESFRLPSVDAACFWKYFRIICGERNGPTSETGVYSFVSSGDTPIDVSSDLFSECTQVYKMLYVPEVHRLVLADRSAGMEYMIVLRNSCCMREAIGKDTGSP